jgi:hypothetical protein
VPLASDSVSRTSAGSDSVTVSISDPNYHSASGTATIAIAKADATVSVAGGTWTYDAASHGASGSVTGVAGDVGAAGSSLNLGDSFTNVPGGTAHWVFTGGTNYEDESGDVAIAITKADATIVVSGYSVTYDGNAHTATGTAKGVGGVDLSAGLTLGGTTHTNAGDYPNDAWSFAGGTNYNNASGTVHDSIAKANVAITAKDASKTYGQTLTFAGTEFTASGLVNGDTVTSVSLTSAGAAATALVGSYPIVPTNAVGTGLGNYTITYRNGTLTVAALPGSVFVLNGSVSGALTVSGNARLATGGNLIVDSSSPSALSASGKAAVSATSIQIVGAFQKSGNATLSTPLATGAAYVSDPLATLAAPTLTGLTNYGSVNVAGNSAPAPLNPGIYTSIKASGNAILRLQPGVYVIAGGGISVTGNASVSVLPINDPNFRPSPVTGNGVLIYNAGSNVLGGSGTPSYGGITLSGNGTVSLPAPPLGTYAGILIFQARDNTRAMSLSGNATTGITGTIYAPAALLSLSGNAQLRTQVTLVVNQLQVSGNGSSALATDGLAPGLGATAGELLAGDLFLYVDNADGALTTDALARLDEAIANLDVLLAAYNVVITETADRDLANLVLDVGTNSAAGGYTDNVLGCFTNSGEIMLIQGWNWYAGADPAAIAAGQYDFQTIVTHELGHALGLGHSADPTSTMYASLATGAARRTLTAEDLRIGGGTEPTADALRAAGFFAPDAGSFLVGSPVQDAARRPGEGSVTGVGTGLAPLLVNPAYTLPDRGVRDESLRDDNLGTVRVGSDRLGWVPRHRQNLAPRLLEEDQFDPKSVRPLAAVDSVFAELGHDEPASG